MSGGRPGQGVASLIEARPAVFERQPAPHPGHMARPDADGGRQIGAEFNKKKKIEFGRFRRLRLRWIPPGGGRHIGESGADSR